MSMFDDFGGSLVNGYPVIDSECFSTDSGTPYLTAPGVALLSRPQVNIQALKGFLDAFSGFGEYVNDPTPLPDSTQLCKVAGQLCYMSFGTHRTRNAETKKYIDHLIASGHGSVFEHANFSLLLYGISRSVTHELVRHRHLSFSQQSQRYVSGRQCSC